MKYAWMLLVVIVLMTAGCYQTMEQRWQAIDAQMQQEIGVKTKDYYYREWGRSARREELANGGETIIWEQKAYGGAQGWRKTLTFSPDGVLREFSRTYWPKDR
ncbi:MAG: hypothetical protein EPO61_05850 [Nitrospirae bacterium]|nr:MAG: hypothetical protein EPO61_05850 [Nitrospirota bacterium]